MAAVSVLSFQSVEVRLAGRSVLRDVTFGLEAGEKVAICGPNGAGKSSLIRAAAGVLAASQGTIELAGQDLKGLGPTERARRRSYLAQDRSLVWNMAAREVAALGAVDAHPAEALARADAALAELEIGHLADRGVAAMSGGERARVLLARTLVAGAPLMLLDEPIAGLDPDAQLLVLDLLSAQAAKGGTIVASLHDLPLAAQWADRVLVLDQGQLVADGPPPVALSSQRLRQTFRLDADWSPEPDVRLTLRSRVRARTEGQ